MPIESPEDLLAQHHGAIARLYQSAQAHRWGLSLTGFGEAVWQSVQRWKPETAPVPLERFLNSLHARDLALAAACRLGLEPAWNEFIAAYRSVLYGAARAIARDEVRGRELADSLYADLYGLEIRAGRRRSLLQYFDGRSSLATWLHAVLARRFVDACRQERRIDSLEDCPPGTLSDAGSAADPPDPDRARYLELLHAALDAALRSLKPRDRLRLGSYYLENLTLKQVGDLLGEHESSVSRRLSHTRKALRRQVDRALRREQRLSDEQIRLCYDYAMQEWPFDLTRALSQSDRT
ncbi:MAG: RNA polymerase sigma factor [Candidatus Binataceae bacterium]